MNEFLKEVMPSLIVGVFSIVGVIITTKATQNKMQTELEKNQAVFNAKMDMLTREVREHNDFAKRVPILETKMAFVEQRISEIEDK